MSDYDYFQERLSQLYVYGRNDVKVMAGWVVTAPQDLEQEQYDDFFLAVYDFLENRYGEENVIQAVVHDDEGGQPHLHFCFIPVVEDKKHEEEYKVCANDVLDRRELRNFHPDLRLDPTGNRLTVCAVQLGDMVHTDALLIHFPDFHESVVLWWRGKQVSK